MSNTASKWLLAIDTSTERAGLAVTNGVDSAALSWRAGRDQTVAVLEQIDRLLDLTGLSTGDLAAIAIATGPGMFNGLRVGMSLAKGLYLGTGAALLGVSTLDVAADPMLSLAPTVVAVVAAGRGRVVWKRYPGEEPPVNGTITELAAVLGPRMVVAGDLDDAQAVTLAAVPGVVVPTPAVRRRRPDVLAEIAWRRFANGERDDPITLAPVYVHGAQAAARGG